MRKSIATVSLSGTLPHKLEAIAAAGFDGIELFEADFINFSGSAAELRARADDLGLTIDLYQPFRDFEGMPEPLFRRSLDRAEAKFDLMQTLGVPLMLVCSNTSAQSLGDAERSSAHLHALAERAARRNLRIGYEALAWGRWVKLYGEAWRIVQRADHPSLGLILDSFHTLSLRDDPAGIGEIPGEKIFFVQMADAPLMAMDVLQWARHHRNFPGQGEFDLAHFFEQALRAGYTGNLSLEIFNDVFRATPNRRTALDAMRSLLYLESQVRQRLAQAGETAVIDEGVTLADPPAAAAFAGFAFIEFAVDAAAGRALGAQLDRFGFQRHGQHRSKDVTLYRQGDIRLVLNAQPGSDAQARFAQQGTSVSTFGLATAEPAQAAARGQALLSARCDSPRGAQELELPAIVSPGGIVMQFVLADQDIDADFVAAAAQAPAADGAGLLAIDHVALGLANDQLDTWTLFSRAVLDLSSGESLELADPFGLIRSRGVANADGSVRFVLNTSVGDNTRTARQVSASGRSGGGVHHIAFRCGDIFDTMTRLRERGARFVPISANYYDDLLARLALDDALVRRMQALDILFDASGDGGRYFHAYSETIDDRFFFEIVQRDGYDAYGALNAPARLASQEQRRG